MVFLKKLYSCSITTNSYSERSRFNHNNLMGCFSLWQHFTPHFHRFRDSLRQMNTQMEGAGVSAGTEVRQERLRPPKSHPFSDRAKSLQGVKAVEPTHTVSHFFFQNISKDGERLHSFFTHSNSTNLQREDDIYVPYIPMYVWHYTYSLQNLEHP